MSDGLILLFFALGPFILAAIIAGLLLLFSERVPVVPEKPSGKV